MPGYYLSYKNGLKATLRYSGEQFLEILSGLKGKTTGTGYSSIVEDLEQRTTQWLEGFKGQGELNMSMILNNNPLVNFAFAVLNDHILANQSSVNSVFGNVTGADGKSLYDHQYDASLLIRALGGLCDYLTTGNSATINPVCGKFMGELPYLADTFSRKNPILYSTLVHLDSIGLSADTISEAYKKGGLAGADGVEGLLLKSLEQPLAPKLFRILIMNFEQAYRKEGEKIDLSGLSLQECISRYRSDGINGTEGLANYIVTNVMGNGTGFGGRIFGGFTGRFLKENPDLVEKAFVESLGYSSGFVDDMQRSASPGHSIGGLEQGLFFMHGNAPRGSSEPKHPLLLWAKNMPPNCLRDENLSAHIRDKGFIGEDGFFGYMRDHLEEILGPFVRADLIDDKTVKDYASRYDTLSHITSVEELIWAASDLLGPMFKKDHKGSPFVNLSARALTAGASPYRFLDDPKYSSGKSEWFQTYFPNEKIFGHLSTIRMGADSISHDPNRAKDMINIFRVIPNHPLQNIMRPLLFYIQSNLGDQSFSEKIKDYAAVVKDISENLLERMEPPK